MRADPTGTYAMVHNYNLSLLVHVFCQRYPNEQGSARADVGVGSGGNVGV